jgi:hypothetical protein
MKRKRGQRHDEDGAFVPEKRKRGGPQPTGWFHVLLWLVVTGSFGIAALVFLAEHLDISRPIPVLPAPATITVKNNVPTQIVGLGSANRPTLPPTWTPLPTNPPTATVTSTATPTVTPTPTTTPELRERVVIISAQAEWQSSETEIQPGDVVEIGYVEGYWLSWPGTGPFGPDGGFFHVCNAVDCLEPLRGYSQAGMIGRIGKEGEMFPVGYKASFVAAASGELQLRINDAYTTDNEGSITMRVIVKRYND